MTDKPVHVVRAGGTKASIWLKHGDEGQPFYSTDIRRSYRDGNGEWKETTTFMPHQLPQLELVARKAYEYTQLTREHSRQANSSEAKDSESSPDESKSTQTEGAAVEEGDGNFVERTAGSRGGRRR